MYTWQLLHTWPDEKAGHFQFQKGKKEILKNFSLIDLKLFLKSISWLLWYIFLYPIKHYPSFTLFLICSYFFTQSELWCSHKVCSYKKRVYLHWKEMALAILLFSRNQAFCLKNWKFWRVPTTKSSIFFAETSHTFPTYQCLENVVRHFFYFV